MLILQIIVGAGTMMVAIGGVCYVIIEALRAEEAGDEVRVPSKRPFLPTMALVFIMLCLTSAALGSI